jgi:hypothetical protein
MELAVSEVICVIVMLVLVVLFVLVWAIIYRWGLQQNRAGATINSFNNNHWCFKYVLHAPALAC